MKDKIPVVVLAATGSVGQRFVQLLDNHPWFKVVALTASDRSEGRTYRQACHWILTDPMPKYAEDMLVYPTSVGGIRPAGEVAIALSALPANIARDVEPEFAQAGIVVCSNASAYRNAEDVPILLPEVNPEHADIVTIQRRKRGWKGAITTNPNCTATGMTVALKALQKAFGLKCVFAVSMQAISGAGYPGVASLDILDNVIPNIGGEEEKVEFEPRKMLGTFTGEEIQVADFVISAHTNRVAVSDGHMVCLTVELEQRATVADAVRAVREYQSPAISADLPSAPNPVLVVTEESDRPQPRLDRNTGKGMTTVVGRIRPDALFDLKMVVLSHNTVRGAAGGSLFNAELLVKKGLVG